MNSYGDPQSARARARVPGPSAASTPDDDPSGSRPTPDAYRRPAGGRASVSGSVPRGAASVGSASVGGVSGRVPVGAPAGRASVGSARVGGPPGEGNTGAYGGRAAVARAAVRPTPAYDELGDPRPVSGGGGKDPAKSAKRRKRANILTAAAAVAVILLGAGVVAGTWFFDDVQLTEPKAEDQVTQILASDKKTQLATIGEQNRSVVPYQQINPVISEAVMAAEDKNFRDHHGIDMKGIVRAAWNNFTGGDTQGASTITQQYARHAAELKEISYNRKLREAVIARKMEDHYSKDEILGRYLNSVYFGRGAYGIEAAVKAYFGSSKSSLAKQGEKGAVTAAEAAVLAAVIKQPEPSAGHKGYDPQNNPQAAQERWTYTLNNMVEKGWLAAAEKPAEYPKVEKFNAEKCRTTCGTDKPSGKIVKYVKQELLAMGIKQDEWTKGGLKIVTTINPDVQRAAEEAVNAKNADSPMSKLKSTYKPAIVAVDPGTGRVLAYYGGPDGDGVSWDFAGPNFSTEDGSYLGGLRPPGSSFKIYTLLAALADGYGFDTTWDSKAKKVGGDAINNSSRTNLKCDDRRCPLETATIESYNFPFYWLAEKLGPAKILEAAQKSGVQYIENPDKIGERIDLSKTDPENLKGFGNEIGFGQYAITVLDHANGVATLANQGKYNKAHFVLSVEKRDQTGKFKPFKKVKPAQKEAFDPNVVANVNDVLKKIPGNNDRALKNGRQSIGKTGTWEYKDGKSRENGDAWMVGATPQIATAVWVGNYDKKNNPMPIKIGDRNMTGGSVPGQLWKLFMDLANKYTEFPQERFPGPTSKVSDPNRKGNGLDPLPPPPDPQQDCLFGGLVCPPGQGNNGGQNNGNNGGQGNGNGNNGNGNGNGNGDPPVDPNQPGTGAPGVTLPAFPTPNDDTDQGGGQNNDEDD